MKRTKKTPSLDWKYDESGQHCHYVTVAGRCFGAYVNLVSGLIHFSPGPSDPRYSKIHCKNWDEVNEKAVEILRKDKEELKKLGI